MIVAYYRPSKVVVTIGPADGRALVGLPKLLQVPCELRASDLGPTCTRTRSGRWRVHGQGRARVYRTRALALTSIKRRKVKVPSLIDRRLAAAREQQQSALNDLMFYGSS